MEEHCGESKGLEDIPVQYVPVDGLYLGLTDSCGLVIVYSGSDMPLYAFSLFLPSIISQVGFSYFDCDHILTHPKLCPAGSSVSRPTVPNGFHGMF